MQEEIFKGCFPREQKEKLAEMGMEAGMSLIDALRILVYPKRTEKEISEVLPHAKFTQ